MAELEFRGRVVAQIGLHDAQRIEVCDMVASDLVGTNEELYLFFFVISILLGDRVQANRRSD